MTLTLVAARLRQVAANIERLPTEDREQDISDRLVPKLVMNAFVDEKLRWHLGRKNKATLPMIRVPRFALSQNKPGTKSADEPYEKSGNRCRSQTHR